MAVYEFAPKKKVDNHIWICPGDTFVNEHGDWVRIECDDDCDSPRCDYNLGTFYTWLNSYASPDEAPEEVEDLFGEFGLEDEWEHACCEVDRRNEPIIAEYQKKLKAYKDECANVRHRIETDKIVNAVRRKYADETGTEYHYKSSFDWFDGDPYAFPVEPKRPVLKGYPNPLMWFVCRLNELGHVALPVSAYIHSGVVYKVGTPSQFPDSQWDAGYAGLIYVTREKVLKEYMVDELTDDLRKRINRYLADEVEYFSEWAEGHTYGYVMTDHETLEEDSCWGFIGDDAATNGMTDYTGDLQDTSLDYDEWLEKAEQRCEEMKEESDFENMHGQTAAYENYAA